MPKELIDDGLWSHIEPLLPVRAPRNRQYAGRKPTRDRAVPSGIVFVLRSGISHGIFSRGKWIVALALRAGDDFSRGSKLASGNTDTKRCWPNSSPWRNRFLARARRQLIDPRRAGGKNRPESHQTVVKPDISAWP